jgi:hypothetical protein
VKKEPRQLHPNRQKAGAHLAVVVPKSDDLRELERVVENHLHAGLEAGRALARIRDEGLYRQEGFKTFEGYLSAKWDLKKRRAYQLIAAAAAVVNVQNFALDASPPAVESHAAALAKLPEPEQQAKAWTAAIETAGEKPVTARIVAKEVAKLLPPPPPKPEAKKEPARAAAPVQQPIASAEPEDEGEGGYEDPVGAEMLFRVDIERELDDVADRWFARCSERETLAQILINLADELRRRDANP